MDFKNIKQFIGEGLYETDVALSRVSANLQSYEEDYGLDLNPDFQRGNVWSDEQRTSYIEFLLRGGKSARVIYFNSPVFGGNNQAKDSDLEETILCIDGLQRLTSVQMFLNNEIKAFDTYYKDFTNFPRNNLTLRFNINNMQYKKDILEWYIDYNSGGTVHSKEELKRVNEMLKTIQ